MKSWEIEMNFLDKIIEIFKMENNVNHVFVWLDLLVLSLNNYMYFEFKYTESSTVMKLINAFLKARPMMLYQPRWEKTCLWGFRPGLTQIGMCSYTRWLEAGNFVFMKKSHCTICVAKTKAQISFAVTAKIRFSHDASHMSWLNLWFTSLQILAHV